MMSMWSWGMIKVVCGSFSIDAPWTQSLLVSPPPSPSIPAIHVSSEVALNPFVDGSCVRGRFPTQPSSHSPSRDFIGEW